MYVCVHLFLLQYYMNEPIGYMFHIKNVLCNKTIHDADTVNTVLNKF